MSTSPSFLEFIIEQLSFVPDIRSKKMFGEYGLYSDKKFFGMVCDSKLFIRATPRLREVLVDDGIRPYSGASDRYYHIPEDYLEDDQKLKDMVNRGMEF